MPGLMIKPFQLLEINIISGQDLELVSKKMQTYATAGVHPKRKLSTAVDTHGHNNPTWNDKFVFRVDEEFLRLDTSAVTIAIYASNSWFRDTLVGKVRVLVGNLIPPPARLTHRQSHHHHHHSGMRFAALQVWRPSGRPQGLLNIGVAVLDSSMRSMPLYTQLSKSAVGYRDLILGQEDPKHEDQNHNNSNHTSSNLPVILRRSRSEHSSIATFGDISSTNGSIVGIAKKIGIYPKKASSVLSDSDFSNVAPKGKNKKGKASSVISGAELIKKPKEKGRKGKGSSLLISISTSFENDKSEKPSKEEASNDAKVVDNQAQVIEKHISKPNKFDFGGPKGSSIVNGKYIYRAPPKPQSSLWSKSEVGPSPSEVAAAMARDQFDDNHSSVLDGWSVDNESMEGLRSKLERWRTELPPLYDRRGFSSSSFRSTSQRIKRHDEHNVKRQADDGGGAGLFSCFSNIYGYECQCICGKPPVERKRNLSFSDVV